jgi:hypothetical protein
MQKLISSILQPLFDELEAKILAALGKTPDSKPAKTASGKPQKEASLQTQ